MIKSSASNDQYINDKSPDSLTTVQQQKLLVTPSAGRLALGPFGRGFRRGGDFGPAKSLPLGSKSTKSFRRATTRDAPIKSPVQLPKQQKFPVQRQSRKPHQSLSPENETIPIQRKHPDLSPEDNTQASKSKPKTSNSRSDQARVERIQVPTHLRTSARVLLVDDNPVNLKVAQRFLERMGCRVESAQNGREAVTITEKVLQACLDCGMNGYLTKPVELSKLRTLLLSLENRTEQSVDQLAEL